MKKSVTFSSDPGPSYSGIIVQSVQHFRNGRIVVKEDLLIVDQPSLVFTMEGTILEPIIDDNIYNVVDNLVVLTTKQHVSEPLAFLPDYVTLITKYEHTDGWVKYTTQEYDITYDWPNKNTTEGYGFLALNKVSLFNDLLGRLFTDLPGENYIFPERDCTLAMVPLWQNKAVPDVKFLKGITEIKMDSLILAIRIDGFHLSHVKCVERFGILYVNKIE